MEANGLRICMNGKPRVKERSIALETSSVRTDQKIMPGWLNLTYLILGVLALWHLVQVFWLG